MQENYKKKLIHHLHRIKGQIEGIERMVENHKYCVNIMVQSLAAEKSLKRFNADLLANHLTEHVPHQFRKGEGARAAKELVKIYNLKH